MIDKRRAVYLGLLGGLSLLASAAAFAGVQICFVQSFWLHAVAFPVNPQTLAQPTALGTLSILLQIAFAVLLLVGLLLEAVCVGYFLSARFGKLKRVGVVPP